MINFIRHPFKTTLNFIKSTPSTPKSQTILWSVITAVSAVAATTLFATAMGTAVLLGSPLVATVGLPLALPLTALFLAFYVSSIALAIFAGMAAFTTGSLCLLWIDRKRMHYFGTASH